MPKRGDLASNHTSLGRRMQFRDHLDACPPQGCTGRVNLGKRAMNLTVEIPDDVAQRLSAVGGDLSRRALEALVAEEYKQGHLTKPDLRRLLGLETSDQIDGFLKAHDVWIDYTLQDLERERASLQRLGF